MGADVQSVGKMAIILNEYGPSITILAVFIIVFLTVIYMIVKSNKDYMKQIADQNKAMITAILNTLNTNNKPNTDNGAIDRFLKLNTRLKKDCKDTLDVIGGNRTGIYTFHNGTTSISGFHFLKISCICEYFAIGSGSISKLQEHSNIPAGLLDGVIEKLVANGNFIIYNNTEGGVYDDSLQIACKILLNNNNESCILYSIYDTEQNPIGFILSEFDTSRVTLNELKEKRQYLRYLSEKVAPILEVSSQELVNTNKNTEGGGC